MRELTEYEIRNSRTETCSECGRIIFEDQAEYVDEDEGMDFPLCSECMGGDHGEA